MSGPGGAARRTTCPKCDEKLPIDEHVIDGKEAVSLPVGAKVSGFGRTLMYEEIKAGRGPRTFTIGRRRLIRVEELRRWLREREANGANSA